MRRLGGKKFARTRISQARDLQMKIWSDIYETMPLSVQQCDNSNLCVTVDQSDTRVAYLDRMRESRNLARVVINRAEKLGLGEKRANKLLKQVRRVYNAAVERAGDVQLIGSDCRRR